MEPTIISETIQQYKGKNYYFCGKYYQKNGVRLHRLVWQDANGEIPKNCHIHHKDEDKTNNKLDNLECLSFSDHAKIHDTEEKKQLSRKNIKKAQIAACLWHGSEEGKEWHKLHWEKNCKEVFTTKNIKKHCQNCSKEYFTTQNRQYQSKFCGNNCKASALRKRRRLERASSILSI